MDDRLIRYKVGQPVPKGDMQRRLDIDRYVGPICMDTGTIFRINSTFMDVTDQPYLRRQIVSLMVMMSFAGFCLGVYFFFLADFLEVEPTQSMRSFLFYMGIGTMAVFGAMMIWSGRDELFSLTRRPIRFNRLQRKIYAIRRRRFFGRQDYGDVSWDIPWTDDTIFCLQAGNDSWGKYYHIVCYQVDKSGNVERAFALGRRWEFYELESALAQWNYWCMYMNEGPENLPRPMLFLAEDESTVETFFICMYFLGLSAPAGIRLIAMPFIVLTFLCRRLSLATCRAPQWSEEIVQFSQVTLNMRNEPCESTPVGWKATLDARLSGEWPVNPSAEVSEWNGLDSVSNARLWA